MDGHLPLSALLARPLAALSDAHLRAGAGTPPDPTLAMWRSMLRAVDGDGVPEPELQQRTALSRRALRSSLTGATRAGWVIVESGGAGRGGKVVRLTEDGVAAGVRWPTIENAAERDWHDMVGLGRSERARTAVAAVVAEFDLEWPHHPVSYGGADPSITGGSHRAADPGPPRVPAHGQDWKPSVRAPGGAVAGLRLDALLSQALVAFASDYEQHGVGSIPLALALRSATDAWVPVVEFPTEARVTGEGKSLLERHAIVELDVDPHAPMARAQRGNLVRPSARGRETRDAYAPTCALVEREWSERFGPALVRPLRSSLEELGAHLPSGLGDFVLARPPTS